MNLDNITRLPDGTRCSRTDELGHFVMRYSDDGGRTWSKERYEVPFRLTSLDYNNTWHGKVKMMWNVDQMKIVNGTVMYAFTKIGTYVQSPPEEVFSSTFKCLRLYRHPLMMLIAMAMNICLVES